MIHEACLEAQSSKAWKVWKGNLSKDKFAALTQFRGGATLTPTRRHFRKHIPEEVMAKLCRCMFCKEEVRGSLRHFVQECPRFDHVRHDMDDVWALPEFFWAQLPECSTKSGWITLAAAPTSWRRAEMQIAVCTVGLEVTSIVPQLVPQIYQAAGETLLSR